MIGNASAKISKSDTTVICTGSRFSEEIPTVRNEFASGGHGTEASYFPLPFRSSDLLFITGRLPFIYIAVF